MKALIGLIGITCLIDLIDLIDLIGVTERWAAALNTLKRWAACI